MEMSSGAGKDEITGMKKDFFLAMQHMINLLLRSFLASGCLHLLH